MDAAMIGRAAMTIGTRCATTAVLVALLGGSGCVMVLGSPLFRGERPLEETTVGGTGRARILLMEIQGVIRDQPEARAFGLVEEESTLGRVRAELQRASEESRLIGVVVHVDSPGGGVTASDEIYAELLRFRQQEGVPVVAVLGGVAASGGYYVACAAERIIAHPTSVTGSIGVIMTSVSLAGLMQKLGITDQTVTSGTHKDLMSPLKIPTPEDRAIVQGVLDDLHARFIAVVRQNRPGLDQARIAEITDGRIFDAQQALALGLVDAVGDMRIGIDAIKRAAGVGEARIIRYRRAGEPEGLLYGQARTPAVEVGLLPRRLDEVIDAGPRFEYRWAPGSLE
jgi:protease-4